MQELRNVHNIKVRSNNVLARLWERLNAQHDSNQKRIWYWEYWTSFSSHLRVYWLSLQVPKVGSSYLHHRAQFQRCVYCRTLESWRAWMPDRRNLVHKYTLVFQTRHSERRVFRFRFSCMFIQLRSQFLVSETRVAFLIYLSFTPEMFLVQNNELCGCRSTYM